MAGKSSTMTRRGKKDFQDLVKDCLARGDLFEPADEYISKMSLLPDFKGKNDEFLTAVMQMVRVAQAMVRSSRYERQGKKWLREAARSLDGFQLAKRDWICDHVWELPRPSTRVKSHVFNPLAGTKDIRYLSEDRARGHADILTCELTQEEEDRILMSSPQPLAMEVDPNSSILDSPKKSPPKPASTVQVVENTRKEKTSSQAKPTTRSRSQHRSSSSVPVEVTSKSRSSSRTYSSPDRRRKQSKSPSRSRKATSAETTDSRTTRSKSVVSRAFSSDSTRSKPGDVGDTTTKITSSRRVTFGESTTVVASDPKPIAGSSMKITILKRKSEVELQRGGKRRTRHHSCWIPVCTIDNKYVKVHAYQHHVPGIFQEVLPANDPQILRGRVRALRTAATWLFGRPATLQEFMDFISSQNVLAATDNSLINSVQVEAMTQMCKHQHWTIPSTFILHPANSLAVLLHWKVILLIAACLEEKEREEWKRLFPTPDLGTRCEEKEPDTLVPEAFDSHFHLDRTLRNCNLSARGKLEDILATIPVTQSETVRLVGTVAVFCDPKTYPTGERLLDLPEDMSVAVGYHPKHSHYSQQSTDDYVKVLKTLLKSSRVVAFGEIGLDHHDDRKYWPAQMDLLERLLPLLQSHHVLVVHCRGMEGDCGTEVYLLLLYLLKKYVDTHHPIHVHCFTGNQYVLQRWLEAFPRSFFGFTNMAQNFNQEQIKALCSIDNDRLLLESDAPYFPSGGSRCSSPGQLYAVAKAVARHRRSSPEHILEMTVANAKHLYGK